MELKDYLQIIWRRKWVLVLTTIVTLLVAAVGTALMTPIYAATTTLRVSPAVGSASEPLGWDTIQYTDRLMSTYTNIILSDPVLDELAYKLGVEEAPPVSIDIPANTELMQITVESPEPRVAAIAADTLAEILMAQVRALVATDGRITREILSEQLDALDKELAADRAAYEALAAEFPAGSDELEEADRRLESKEQVYHNLLERFEQSRINEAVRANTVSVIMPATVPQQPSKPNKILNLLVGGVLGVVGGLGLVFLFENLSFSTQPAADAAQPAAAPAGAYWTSRSGRRVPVISSRGARTRLTRPVAGIASLVALSVLLLALAIPRVRGQIANAATVSRTATVATTARAGNGAANATPPAVQPSESAEPEGEGEVVTDTQAGEAGEPEAAPAGATTLSLQVQQSSDDSEETLADGTINRASSDLELGNADGQIGLQLVGIRFQNVTIPQGATITHAYVELVANEVNEGEASLLIQGEAVDNAPPFNWGDGDISTRARTTASVAWEGIPPWLEIGARHRSPDLAPIIQELVDRSGWQSGNALALIISGSGKRTADAYDGEPGAAPVLQIEYVLPPP